MAIDPMTGKELSSTAMMLQEIHGELVKLNITLAELTKAVTVIAQRTPR